mmetsp:Transcript_76498/g.216290  ORF Transcript_76498/g.216290 Transcript_76498/m.216290 type:complete len:297 (+) Transcript_76498:134-1024(+)
MLIEICPSVAITAGAAASAVSRSSGWPCRASQQQRRNRSRATRHRAQPAAVPSAPASRTLSSEILNTRKDVAKSNAMSTMASTARSTHSSRLRTLRCRRRLCRATRSRPKMAGSAGATARAWAEAGAPSRVTAKAITPSNSAPPAREKSAELCVRRTPWHIASSPPMLSKTAAAGRPCGSPCCSESRYAQRKYSPARMNKRNTKPKTASTISGRTSVRMLGLFPTRVCVSWKQSQMYGQDTNHEAMTSVRHRTSPIHTGRNRAHHDASSRRSSEADTSSTNTPWERRKARRATWQQ